MHVKNQGWKLSITTLENLTTAPFVESRASPHRPVKLPLDLVLTQIFQNKMSKCSSLFSGLKRIVVYILYSILVLLMLILLLVTGIKCTSLQNYNKVAHYHMVLV